MHGSKKYKDELRLLKSVSIVSSLQKVADQKALNDIKQFYGQLNWKPLNELSIDKKIWDYIVKKQKYDPKLIFCHPDVILSNPKTILYYRGLCGLSLKSAKDYVGSIESLEEGNPRAHIDDVKAKKIANTFNTFICAVIRKLNGWSLENGQRTIIATMGITLDGSNRARVGKKAESLIQRLVIEWLLQKGLIDKPKISKKEIVKKIPHNLLLKNNIEIKFGSEPDISFIQDKNLLAVVEIKGGIDPAGALERYGAARKSFEHATKVSPRCKNFYLCGVFTSELIRRIEETRLIDKYFDIIEIIENPVAREFFFKELFHHALRIV